MADEEWPSDSWPRASPPPDAPESGPPPLVPGPPPAGWSQPSTAYAPGAPWGLPPPSNKTGVVALVAGCAGFITCGVGSIVAVITGHVARGQIRRSQGAEGGNGVATAGLVLGYVGIGCVFLGGIGLGLLLYFADDIDRHQLREQARDYVENAEDIAGFDSDLRDPVLLELAYAQMLDDDEDYGDIYLASGEPIVGATDGDWERSSWQVELFTDSFDDAFVCSTIPERRGDPVVVTNGECER